MRKHGKSLSRPAAAVVLACHLLAGALTAPAASAAPPSFEDTFVGSVSGPTDMAWTPDGRMLVTGKNGRLWVHQDGVVLPTPAVDLAAVMCTNGERGLGGVAVHPGFATNRFVYLYYTFNKNGNCNESEVNGPVNGLCRFVLSDTNVVDRASETVMFETPPLFRDHHNGGDVEFGKDGHLYVTVGDGGTSRFNWPQDLGRLLGKVVRVTDSGGIPPDNPYVGAGTARCASTGVPPAGSPAGTKCQEVFASGLRNPFRAAHDPDASGVRYFINDVGQHTWEEVNEGGAPGANYGWPQREGPCVKDSATDCPPPPAGVSDPVYAYQHGVDGAAITGGAFVPRGVWPSEYDGAYLFADYVFGTMYTLSPGGTGWSRADFSPAPEVTAMRFGPYGSSQALYYVTRAGSQIRRIAYTGALDRAPRAAVVADPPSGPTPLTVTFDGRGSSDPDGDPLVHEWDFGDGTTGTGPVVTHTYTAAGTYLAQLTVRDPSGLSDMATARVDVGNTPPSASIDTPVDGARFAVGEELVLHGTATDAEDGALPSTSLTWEVLKHHATHTHPVLDPTRGNDLRIRGPEPEDLDAAGTTWLEIRMTATDSRGATTTTVREVHPRTVDLAFATEPAGLRLVVAGETLTAPATVRSWEAWDIPVSAPAQTDAAGTAWSFASWSDGGAASHRIRTPATPAGYTATFREGAVETTQTFLPEADTYVRSTSPTTAYGTASSLRTDADPPTASYLRFDLSGVGASVTRAVLRVHASTGNSRGYEVRGVPDTAWTEAGTTYANAPSADPSPSGASGPVVAGTWTEVDVTALVTGSGLRSLQLSSPSTTATSFASRETGTTAPQLVVTSSGGAAPDATPPSTPSRVTAAAVDPRRVDVHWEASGDDVGVVGYRVYRDGTPVGNVDGSTLSFQDTSVQPATSYAYTVDAVDAAGNRSGQSFPADVTTPPDATPTAVTLTPVADAYVKADEPARAFGTRTSLRTDASPDSRSHLRFDLRAVSGTVERAVLRVHALTSNSLGHQARGVLPADWSESTITYDTAPAVVPTVTASSGPVTGGTWTEVDVTELVQTGRLVEVALTSASTTATSYASREAGATAPLLVVSTRP